jgi:hypothetical protein
MSVLPISKETKDKTLAKAGLDEQRIKETVEILKEWLQKQPHLPQDYGKYCNISLTLFGLIFMFQSQHMSLMDFVVSPPGCDRSVTDF